MRIPEGMFVIFVVLATAPAFCGTVAAQNSYDERRALSRTNMKALHADPAVRAAFDPAIRCSGDLLVKYTINTTEPANIVAKAAYAGCSTQWRHYVSTVARLAPKYDIPLNETDIEKLQEKTTVDSMTSKVVDLRSQMK